MTVLKFGGTSVGSAFNMVRCASIIEKKAQNDNLAVVVSAVGGVSNLLQKSINTCTCQKDVITFVGQIKDIHTKILDDLQQTQKGFDKVEVLGQIEPLFLQYQKLLETTLVLKECPKSVHCKIMSTGEYLCVPIIKGILQAKGISSCLFDSRDYIFTTGSRLEGDIDYNKTFLAFSRLQKTKDFQARVLLFPGFMCSWWHSTTETYNIGLLGRNGSDFSAAVVAAGLGAKKVEFWSDVDGIYTADPRVVKDAILVDDMSYEEAMELSFFGSKVLHPKTLSPLRKKDIEAWCLNTKNPQARGTRIAKGPFSSFGAVRGISGLKSISMISVSGAGMKGKSGTASRIFSSAARTGVSILLITQSSSEYTISFCVNSKDTILIKDALQAEFALEIKEKLIDPIQVHSDCGIVSIVGDKMKEHCGVAATFFDSLSSSDINIFAIAQGAQERSISAVVKQIDTDTAVRIAHRFFFATTQTIQAFFFGVGAIGGELLQQIKAQQKELLSQNIDLQVLSIANSKKMLLTGVPLALENWQKDLVASSITSSIDTILDFVKTKRPLNPIFVDCTASDIVAKRYLDIFESGMHIATPNKKANSFDMGFYKALRQKANSMHRRFLYETNVGAGLPIIDTLQNMFKSGDTLTAFQGIMSGSLSYIFGRLQEDVPFSQAVKEAKDLKFTEPDPRDDLNGLDVARKALIVAREAGYNLELKDIELNSIFPKDFLTSGSTQEFMARLPQIDEYFKQKVQQLKQQGKSLKMGAYIKDGKCCVGIMEAQKQSPLFSVSGGENAFVFYTKRYSPIPLTIKGYGAGKEVTAAGVFSDILRTVSFIK